MAEKDYRRVGVFEAPETVLTDENGKPLPPEASLLGGFFDRPAETPVEEEWEARQDETPIGGIATHPSTGQKFKKYGTKG